MITMRSVLIWVGLYGLGGLCTLAACHSEVTPKPTPEYPMSFVQVPRFDKVGEQPVPEAVSSPMPDPLYERPAACPKCTIAVPGRWLWQGQWVWAHTYCEAGKRDSNRTRFLCTDSELICTAGAAAAASGAGAQPTAHADSDPRRCELRYLPEQYRQQPGSGGQVGTFRQAYWGMIQQAAAQE